MDLRALGIGVVCGCASPAVPPTVTVEASLAPLPADRARGRAILAVDSYSIDGCWPVGRADGGLPARADLGPEYRRALLAGLDAFGSASCVADLPAGTTPNCVVEIAVGGRLTFVAVTPGGTASAAERVARFVRTDALAPSGLELAPGALAAVVVNAVEGTAAPCLGSSRD